MVSLSYLALVKYLAEGTDQSPCERDANTIPGTLTHLCLSLQGGAQGPQSCPGGDEGAWGCSANCCWQRLIYPKHVKVSLNQSNHRSQIHRLEPGCGINPGKPRPEGMCEGRGDRSHRARRPSPHTSCGVKKKPLVWSEKKNALKTTFLCINFI